MPSKEYDHYLQLSKENLITTIEQKDTELENIRENFKNMEELKTKYYEYNKFHMEEISRLDKIIGKFKGLKKLNKYLFKGVQWY